MTCLQFVDRLYVYYEGCEVFGPGASLQELEDHAAGCQDCLNFMKTYEATLRVGARIFARTPPADLEGLLRARIMAAVRAGGA